MTTGGAGGAGLGPYNAVKLAFPDFVTGAEMFSFGHMRQVHVMAVILGWISGAFAMKMMYMFWFVLIGFITYWVTMTIAGLIQGASKIYEVPYIETVMAEHPYMIGRSAGGTMVFTGNLVWLYTMWMTAREGTVVPEGRYPHELAYER